MSDYQRFDEDIDEIVNDLEGIVGHKVKKEDIITDKEYNKWAVNFSRDFCRLTSAYTPQYGNVAIKDVNVNPQRVDPKTLQRLLQSPQNAEVQLRNLSEFLYYVVTEYMRQIAHIGNILDFSYELIPLNIPKGGEEEKRFIHNEKKCNAWLKAFRPKVQLPLVAAYTALKGGQYYYLRFGDYRITLQDMPEEYCYITSKDERLLYTYAVDMTFFDKYPNAISGYAPEFAEWYSDFVYDRSSGYNRSCNNYRRIPEDRGAVFKLDNWSPLMRPPFTGTFKDAIQIEDYKDLLRLQTQLDTWKVVFQKLPEDKQTGKPLMLDGNTVAGFVNMVQQQLPQGVLTAASPFEVTPVSFDQSQNMNQIVGKGQEVFYQTTGNAPLFASNQSGNYSMRMAIMSDYLLMEPLYNQFEEFINYHLRKICAKDFQFEIKFLRRSTYFLEEDLEKWKNAVLTGAPPESYLAALGYEPFQIQPMLERSKRNGLRELMIPLQTAHTMSADKGGAPKKKESELSDAGGVTASRGDNDEQIT